ncbi:MAG: hypothetical protein DRH57_02345 [Candidatus Cloacimonadota bacterium]|nr:MAG: hypothetical protein DRH57_02345 [Candidatus Cloacimonadota bacterium]
MRIVITITKITFAMLFLMSCSGTNTEPEIKENKAEVQLLNWNYDSRQNNHYQVKFNGKVKNVGDRTAHLIQIGFYYGENPTEDKKFWISLCDFDNYISNGYFSDNALSPDDTTSFESDWYNVSNELFYQMNKYYKKNINIQILWDQE